MRKLTRRNFLKSSSAAAGVVGMGAGADLWSDTRGPSIPSTTFYVAANGNDDWSGKLPDINKGKTDGPFATLQRAREAVGAVNNKLLRQAISVLVREGKYYLKRPVLLGEKDSGGPGFPIAYKAYPGEKVVLSGGKVISGWKPYEGPIVQTSVPGTKGGEWRFRQLFLNGEPQRRARYPKHDTQNPLYGGWLFAEGAAEKRSNTAFVYKPGTFPRHWAKPGNGEIVMFPGGGWVDAVLPIKSMDEKTRTITAEHGYRNPDIAPWYVPDSFLLGDRFRVENLLEELTEPGEWCLDSEGGILYFWPPNGALKPVDEVVAPTLDTLVDIDGGSWLVISGFTFTETAGGDDLHRFGLDGYGAMYPNQGWKYCGEALHMKDAEHCVIENNLFYAVGGNAIYLERYNARNLIRRNEISHVGANGVSLLGNHVPSNSVSQPMRAGRQPCPVFNEVTDNFIHHCGELNKYIAGVFLGVSDSNLVAHNRFEQLPHHAINLGLNGYGRNIVEYNDIQHVCLELRDNGAINSWMDDPQSEERAGHVIRFNRIIDVPGCRTNSKGEILVPDGMANGIYLDNDSSNCVIHGNVIVRSSGYAVFVHGGGHNIIENNIIVDATTTCPERSVFGCGQIAFAAYLQVALLSGNQFCNNIVYYQKGRYDGPIALFCFHPWGDNNQGLRDLTEAISQSRRNLFFRRDGEGSIITQTSPDKQNSLSTEDTTDWLESHKLVIQKTLSLSEWQALGFDTDSNVADPMFVDPRRDDYGLMPESPAIRMGFVPINLAEIGIRSQS
jgi:hypothetical protein